MQIEISEPYKSLYKPIAYLYKLNNGRNLVLFTRPNGTITGTSYARYLMSVHLGYIIPDELHVDHINNDKTDDRIENFQLLTPKENIKKYYDYYHEHIKKTYKLKCHYCGNEKEISESKNSHINKRKYRFHCSRVCVSKSQTLDSAVIDFINQSSSLVFTNEDLARMLDLDSTTVAKHRHNFPKNGTGRILTEEIMIKMNELAKTGMSSLKIAHILGISPSAVLNNRKFPSRYAHKKG